VQLALIHLPALPASPVSTSTLVYAMQYVQMALIPQELSVLIAALIVPHAKMAATASHVSPTSIY